MRLEVILPTVDIVRWGFSDFLFQYVRYIHAVIVFQGFFSSLRSEVLCIISVEYTQCDFYQFFSCNDLFTFQKFCACVYDTCSLLPSRNYPSLGASSNIFWISNQYFWRTEIQFHTRRDLTKVTWIIMFKLGGLLIRMTIAGKTEK